VNDNAQHALKEQVMLSRSSTDHSRRHFLSRSALFAAGGMTVPLAATALTSGVASLQTLEGSEHKTQKVVSPPPPPVTRILAEWVAHAKPETVPEAAKKEAVRSIVNWLGVTIGGSSEEAVRIALATLLPLCSSNGVSVFGRAETLNLPWAALVNGISSHVLDFDDTDLRTIIHPAGSVAAALLALGQNHPINGAEFLHAFIVGVEVECRLGRAIYPSHYDMGWHITGTCSAFGAAAACARLLRLDSRKTQMALGIAATGAAGLKIMFGSMCKSLNVGHAAENGLMAALLAQNGFTSADDAIEGKEGYIYTTSTQHNYAALIDGLGEHYEVTHNTYKPFACGIVIHPAIDAALQLRGAYHLEPAEIRSITIRANPLVQQLTGKQEPRSGLEGKFSVYHSVAVALVRGYAGPAEYIDAAVNDPVVVALRKAIVVRTDPQVRADEVFMTLTTADGRTLERHVEHAVGSFERPLTNAELDEKYRQLTKDVLPKAQSERLLAMAWQVEKSRDVAELARLGALQGDATRG
jgi:2-methylcitrate dehydratase PrpD